MIPAAAVTHYRQQQAIAVAAAAKVDQIWRLGMADDFDLAWSRIAGPIFATVVAAQQTAAATGLAYVPQVLAEQGLDAAAVAEIDPARFAGGTSEGQPVEYLLGAAPIKAKTSMKVAQSTSIALTAGAQWIQTITLDAVRDANRDAVASAMTVRPDVSGWVRMLNPPSCKFCVVLAGKFYRWNAGFQRHPHCDCRHIPGRESTLGDARVDPYAYFRSLDKTAQDRLFGTNDAQAIRDGGDIFRVVNTRLRGLSKTTGRAGWQARRYGTPSKLTIDDVYAAAGDDREKAIQLMRDNGFITGDQNAAGNILGSLEDTLGAGKLGRGGTRVGATRAYRTALATGVRNPLEPATQTAAEARFHTAVLMKQAVERGSNPFAANSLRNPLTPEIRSTVERNYRQQVAALEADPATGRAAAPEQVRVLARLLGIIP